MHVNARLTNTKVGFRSSRAGVIGSYKLPYVDAGNISSGFRRKSWECGDMLPHQDIKKVLSLELQVHDQTSQTSQKQDPPLLCSPSSFLLLSFLSIFETKSYVLCWP